VAAVVIAIVDVSSWAAAPATVVAQTNTLHHDKKVNQNPSSALYQPKKKHPNLHAIQIEEDWNVVCITIQSIYANMHLLVLSASLQKGNLGTSSSKENFDLLGSSSTISLQASSIQTNIQPEQFT